MFRLESIALPAGWRRHDRTPCSRNHAHATVGAMYFLECSAIDLWPARPWLRNFTMPLGEHVRWGHIGERRLQFVLPAGYNVALSPHHRLKAGLSDLCRVVLLLLSYLSTARHEKLPKFP